MRPTKTFKMPPRCDIETITLKETDGQDEAMAAVQARAKGDSASVTDELVRASIAKVNGQAVGQPFADYDKWSTRTRAFALAAWRSINGATDAEGEVFLQGGVDDPLTPSASSVGASGGSGSG